MSIHSSVQAVTRQKLSDYFGGTGTLSFTAVGGGSINDTYCISFSGASAFCKINSATKFPHLFREESRGLTLLAQQKKIRTPAVIDCFETEGFQLLLLEWIQEGERSEQFWKAFGEQLASLHQVTSPKHGLAEDNYMGSVPQQNTRHENWIAFFAQERLSPMIKQCAAKKLLRTHHLTQFEALQKKLPQIFNEEKPSLLHGDLWSGNFLCNQAAEPVLIDPAVYYGHRSVDLAMTTLFGGFRQPFYEAYHYHFPLPSNYEEQWAACNLYPLLIHLYLFGSGYLSQIERTLKQFA
jgi:fructosamine-3-kinase